MPTAALVVRDGKVEPSATGIERLRAAMRVVSGATGYDCTILIIGGWHFRCVSQAQYYAEWLRRQHGGDVKAKIEIDGSSHCTAHDVHNVSGVLQNHRRNGSEIVFVTSHQQWERVKLTLDALGIQANWHSSGEPEVDDWKSWLQLWLTKRDPLRSGILSKVAELYTRVRIWKQNQRLEGGLRAG